MRFRSDSASSRERFSPSACGIESTSRSSPRRSRSRISRSSRMSAIVETQSHEGGMEEIDVVCNDGACQRGEAHHELAFELARAAEVDERDAAALHEEIVPRVWIAVVEPVLEEGRDVEIEERAAG